VRWALPAYRAPPSHHAVISIQDRLGRIRQDPVFSASNFTIGYYDRVEQRVSTLALMEIHIGRGNRFCLVVTEPNATLHDVP